MKKNLALVIFFAAVHLVHAQTNPSKSSEELSDSTGFGSPDGKAVSKQIGTAGGNIASDDGRVELIFPAGALVANTTIRIQPTTNPAPNGVGKSYWFEPSGIQFKKPVQIIFHYTEKEGHTCPPEWMSLGIQDHQGKWSIIDYDDFDSVGKKLKGLIHHFSAVSNIDELKLVPDKEELFVGDSTIIELDDISSLRDSVHYDLARIDRNMPVLYFVNYKLNGDAKNGTIKTSSLPLGKKTKIRASQYNAPAMLAPFNLIEIFAEVYRKSKKGKTLVRRIRCTLYLKDAYRVQVVHEFTGRAAMGSKIVDSASFTVTISIAQYIATGRLCTVTDIKNYSPIVLQNGKKAPFKETILVDGALGCIQLTNTVKNDSLSNDYPKEVYFEFATFEILWYREQVSARGIRGDPASIIDFSIPEEINFIANRQLQRYNVTAAKATYKLIVTPWKEQSIFLICRPGT